MKFVKKLLKSLSLGVALILVALAVSGSNVFAADPAGPKFNFFTDAPNVGAESDFLRVQKADGTRVNTLEQCDGEVNMWFYVHNSQAAANNGTDYNGVGVAHDTRLRVQLPTGTGTSREMKAFVSASNADTVTDNAFITCNGTPISLEYAGLTELYTTAPEGYDLIGSLTSAQGARLALKGHQGDIMPGCWDHRVRLTFKVKIKKQETQPSLGVCKAVDFVVDKDKRKVSVNKVTADLTNATVVGHKIEWGDGSTPSTNETDSHVFTKDTSKVTVSIQVKFADGHMEWLTATKCALDVNFTTTPTPTPTELPKTGPGDVAGIFAAVTVAGALVHKYILSRRYDA